MDFNARLNDPGKTRSGKRYQDNSKKEKSIPKKRKVDSPPIVQPPRTQNDLNISSIPPSPKTPDYDADTERSTPPRSPFEKDNGDYGQSHVNTSIPDTDSDFGQQLIKPLVPDSKDDGVLNISDDSKDSDFVPTGRDKKLLILLEKAKKEFTNENINTLSDLLISIAQKFKGQSRKIDTPYGSFTLATFWGNPKNPKITTKAKDYEKAKLSTDYPDIIRGLRESGLTDAQIAKEILDVLKNNEMGEYANTFQDNPSAKRALVMFIGITCVAEQIRSSVAKDLAKAHLNRTLQNKTALDKAFCGQDADFRFARQGGTEKGRRVARGDSPLNTEESNGIDYITDSSVNTTPPDST